ncbi:hypothetical protein B0H14DRAFT_3470139 [Mycena olivaceomarginata]|nr:hypothetical protein B0H14DRAFT_3470139 [Mycena olivaceomarginata]
MHLRYQIYAQLMLYTLGIFFVFACEHHLPSVTLAPQSKVTHKIASFVRWEYCQEALLPPSLPPPLSPQLRTALLACTPRRLGALPTYRPFCRPSSRHPIVSSACFAWTPSPAFTDSSQCILIYHIYAQLMLYALGIFVFVFACERHLPSVTLAPQSKVTHKIASFVHWEYCQEALLPPSLPPSPLPCPSSCVRRCLHVHLGVSPPTVLSLSTFLPTPHRFFAWTPAPSPFSVHLYGAAAAPTLAFGDSVSTLPRVHGPFSSNGPIPRSLDLNALLFSYVFFPPRVALR